MTTRRPQPAGSPRERLAVYPGSFDPLTNGHVDLIRRGARLFDRIVVAILVNEQKRPLFTTDERVAMAREVFRDDRAIEVDTFDGLLVEYVDRKGASAIVRGLRAVSDFEYEMQMAMMNRQLDPGVETVFLMPAVEYSYVSSRLVKEVAMLGGRLQDLVPAVVARQLERKRAARAQD
jgi:pantetheine-phosphate adenylyltransferase